MPLILLFSVTSIESEYTIISAIMARGLCIISKKGPLLEQHVKYKNFPFIEISTCKLLNYIVFSAFSEGLLFSAGVVVNKHG